MSSLDPRRMPLPRDLSGLAEPDHDSDEPRPLMREEAVAQAAGLSVDEVRALARREGWRYRVPVGCEDGPRHYFIDDLPDSVRSAVRELSAVPAACRMDITRSGKRQEAGWEAIARASNRERAEMRRRIRIVKAYLEETEAAPRKRGRSAEEVVLEMEGPEAPSARTLHRWVAAWREWGSAGLLPRRSGRCGRGGAPWSDEAKKFVEVAWLLPLKPSVALVSRLARRVGAERGWVVPSDMTIGQHLRRLPAKAVAVSRDREDLLPAWRAHPDIGWIVRLVEEEMIR